MEKINTDTDLLFFGWIVGFTDGEGCFCVSFTKNKRYSCNLEVRPSFSLSQKKHSLESLKLLHFYFDCGGIRYSKKDGMYKFEIRKLEDLCRVVIPFFLKYPLKTKKKDDFILFVFICESMFKSYHLNINGLTQIIESAYVMNGSGKRKYSKDELLRFITS
jgi:hypothetical protein